MENKVKEIIRIIESSSSKFEEYLERYLSEESIEFIKMISKKSNAYVFSGIIRDFFLHEKSSRDLDIIIDYTADAKQYIEEFSPIKNSFKGYKLKSGKDIIDIWFLKDTWAFNNDPKIRNLNFPGNILKSTFFNFSSIIYDLKIKKFYFDINFINFLLKKELEVVYEPNPNLQLCLASAVYYAEKFDLKFGPKLKNFLLSNFDKMDERFEDVQLNHFKQILYTETIMTDKIKNL